MTDTTSVTGTEETATRQEGVPATEHVLQDRTPQWLRISPIAAGFVAALSLLFLILNHVPIWHTDVWGHLAYGRWIDQNGRIPSTEPLMPLARGMPFVDTAWLTEWLAFKAYAVWGPPIIQAVSAALVTTLFGVLAVMVYRRSGRLMPAILAALAFGWLNYEPLMVQRPQLAGMVCFTLLFCWLTSPRRPVWHWIAVPALFALWSNLHGSFPVGLVLIAVLGIGSALDLALRRAGDALTRPPGSQRTSDVLKPGTDSNPSRMTARTAAASKPRTSGDAPADRLAALVRLRPVRLFLLLELAAAAALLNPYGIGVYAETLTFSRNPNLADLVEWDPLTVRMLHGQAAAVVGVALAIAYRLSPRRARWSELLALLVLGGLALWHSRMLVWWSVPAAYYLGLHAGAVWSRSQGVVEIAPRRAGKWAVVAVGTVWICFACTPLGFVLMQGRPRDPRGQAELLRRSVSRQTPVAAVEYINSRRLLGPFFNTYEWGDYLLWAGPPGVQVFLNSHAHLIPAEVWIDYMRISRAGDGWQFGLDRYGVNAVLLDHRGRGALIAAMRQSNRWTVAYEDSVAIVFVRARPIETSVPIADAGRDAAQRTSIAGSGRIPPLATGSLGPRIAGRRLLRFRSRSPSSDPACDR